MKISKRMLAVLCTLLMLASCFALPYGAMAAEEETTTAETGTTLPYYTVGRLQAEGEEWTQTTGHTFGEHTFTPSETITLDNWSNYMIAMEVKITQDFGFKDIKWMDFVRNGGLKVTDAAGTTTQLTNNPIYAYIPSAIRVEGEWMQVYVPLSGMPTEGSSYGIANMKLMFYNDTANYTENGITGDNNTGVSASVRNIQVLDISRSAEGGPNSVVAMFGTPDVEMSVASTKTSGDTPSIPNTTSVMYNLMTKDMNLSDLVLEFDIKRTGDGDITKMQNGEIRLYSGDTEHQSGGWSNGVITKADTWYHISRPLSEFTGGTALTDASGITRVYAFDYNDGGIENFVSTYKNVKITHKAVTDLEDALDAAKTYIYEADANAAAYEKELNDARALFSDSTATYADFATALTELNAAKDDLNGLCNALKEVGHVTGAETTYTNVKATNRGTQIATDWKNVGGSLDLTDGKTYAAVNGIDPAIRGAIGENRYFTAKVTISRNTAYTGDLALSEDDPLPALSKMTVNFRSSNATDKSVDDNAERRTNPYTMYTVGTPTTNADGSVTYTMELLLDDSSNTWTDGTTYDRRVDWSDIISVNMWWDFSSQIAEKANNSDTNIVMSIDELKFVNKTAEIVEAQLAECAAGNFPAGKYTAVSMASYLALKEQAQAMLDDDDATLQEKSQLVKAIDAAKAEFDPVIAEYVQFGEPDVESVKTNTGIENSHGLGNNTIPVNKMTLTGTEEISKLQLRIEYLISREDGEKGKADQAVVNGNLQLQGASSEIKYDFGGSGLFPNAVGDEWGTLYLDLSSFSNATVENLRNVTKLVWTGYNDLRNHTSTPGVTIKFRNVAIIDNTNVAAVDDLKAAFEDVTKGGTVDFTTESYAAYKAVYDEWYPVYEAVDLDQADDAITAMADAYKLLVCVNKQVVDISGFNGESGAGDNYLSRDVRFPATDLSLHNVDNLRLRFNLRLCAEDGSIVPPKDNVTVHVEAAYISLKAFDANNTETNLALKEKTYQLGDNSVEISLKDMSPYNKETLDLTNVSQLQITCYVKEVVDGVKDKATLQKYKLVISDAEFVDITKDAMVADLKANAEITIADLEAANGCAYDVDSTAAYVEACNAALALVNTEDPRYADLTAAQKAIDDAKAQLKAVGHVVASFDATNGYSDSVSYIQRDVAVANKLDLSAYDVNKLTIRMRITVSMTDGSTPTNTIKVASVGYLLHSTDANKTEGQNGLLNQGLKYGVNDIAIPVKNLAQNGWGSGAGDNPVDMTNIDKLKVYGYVKETIDGSDKNATSNVRMTVDNACIVDTTAEENLGTVKAVGNGRVNITGGYLYGRDDTLTATTSSANSTFVGWKKNDTFVPANGETDALTLPVNGKQNITAYFAAADETVVVYTGKYNRVIDVQVVKAASELVAPAAPAITGQTLNGWDVEGDALAAAVDSAKGGFTTVTAVYETDTTAAGYTVTVENATAVFANVTPEQTENGAYVDVSFDTRVSLTAQAPVDGQVFSYWIVNDKIAGYADTLTAYVSGTMTIKAVFVEDEAAVAAPELQAGITQAEMVANGETYNFEIIAQTYLPDDYELMAYGVIFAPTEGDLTAADGKTLDVVSSSNIPNRQYKITLENVKAGKTRWAMAYITARDAEGNVTTVYSDAVFAETPAAE